VKAGAVETIKFWWKLKYFEEKSWKQIRKHLTFEEPEAEAFFIKHGTGMWKRELLNFCGSGSSTFKERSWKQTPKRLTLYGAGSRNILLLPNP